MKKISTIKLLFLLAILSFPGVIGMSQIIALQRSDVIVRYAFRGWENMFHAPYEYYAIGSNSYHRILDPVAKERFGEEVETRKIYDDGEEVNYWLVDVIYYTYDDYLQEKDQTIETTIGKQYRATYYDRKHKDEVPSEEEKRVMAQVAEKLYQYHEPNPKNREGGRSVSIFDFMLAHRGDDYLIEDCRLDVLYRINKKGELVKIMKFPEGGQFDYYYFYGED